MNSYAFRFRRFLSIVVIAMTANATPFAQSAPILSAVYDPATGGISMKATENGAPASLSIATFQFLSPDSLLSGSAALIPTAAASFATVLNTDTSFVVDPPSAHAEIYATNFSGVTPLFTSIWDLGVVAAVGLSQAQIHSGFSTDADITPGGLAMPGAFTYQVQGSPEFQVGQITAVPEPSTTLILASAGIAVGLWRLRRRSC